jgi:hypothetical protein
VSSQLRDYIKGSGIEFTHHVKPATVFLRTTDNENQLYVFSYLAGQQGLVQDAWHRWEYPFPLVGMAESPEGLMLFFKLVLPNGETTIICVQQPMLLQDEGLPHLDAIRPLGVQIDAFPDYSDPGAAAQMVVGTQAPYTGTSWDRYVTDSFSDGNTDFGSQELVVGYPFTSLFTPSVPQVRDRNGVSILPNKVTVRRLLVETFASGGLTAECTYRGVPDTFVEIVNVERVGVVIGEATPFLTTMPLIPGLPGEVADVVLSVPIGHNTRDYEMTLRSRWWMPLRITTLTWVGQIFNRTQRI